MSARARARATAVAVILVAFLAVWWYARPTPSVPTPLPPAPPVALPTAPSSPTPAPRPPRSPEIHEIDLGWIEDPAERALVAEVATAIDRGGPFAHKKDGAVFQNREAHLPARPPGYWREYTVPTPGSRDRGARRLVAGQRREIYYTRDHYRTFAAVRGATP